MTDEGFALFAKYARAMRDLGAVSFRAGDFACEWGPVGYGVSNAPATSVPQETVSPAQSAGIAGEADREAEAQAEHESLLFWSSEG